MLRLLKAAAVIYFAALPFSNAYACCECIDGTCLSASAIIINMHAVSEPIIMGHISEQFNKQREWDSNTFLKNKYLPAVRALTAEKVVVGSQQAMIAGRLMDADLQIDAQRDMQGHQVEVTKQYQPDEGLMCTLGTNVRSLASSEDQGRLNASALSARSLSRQLGESGTSSAISPDSDKEARWKQFTATYCDIGSNNPDPANAANSGMALACGTGPADKTRVNKDIEFTRTIDDPRTLDVNFKDAALTHDEEDVQAFLDHIFPPLSRQVNAAMQGNTESDPQNLALRSVAAKRGVAQNSFNAIIGMKSAGTSDEGNTREFLAAIMKELGVKDDEIYTVIGNKPSYYAQLEILGKRLYQTPGFYTQLYDKPANVERKAVALKAIDMMLDRALYESEVRQEMLMSVLLASKTRDEFKKLNRDR